MATRSNFESVDQYISTFPEATQLILQKIRQLMRTEMPDADEVTSYQIPCFKLGGHYVVYFAGYANHVSVYPLPKKESLRDEIKPYIHGRGTARFSLDKPIPYDLIRKIVIALKNQAR